MTTPALHPQHLRSCLSRFVTGVAVISYEVDDQPRGVTVNSFTSVSMEPPLILVSLAKTAKATANLEDRPFTINVLKASQLDIAMQFAGRPRAGLELRWLPSSEGLAPALHGALATFRCRPWKAYDGGDHVLQLGEVIEAEVSEDPEPLLFDRGRFAMVGLSVHDHPRVLDAGPIIGGGIVQSHLVHHLAG
ncbi:flavin reductase family protein [Kribbella sp. NBC_00382]|uniref:flavin reductase family protein n=1 Tax=Kribbella sp. NBC_00382 TaxID=2975967 RepID=UPI002E22DB9E